MAKNKEGGKGLFRSTAVVSGMTMISRVLGFVRDMVIARIFGAGAETDAFFVAFKIPNFLRRLFAEGAFSQAFVPVLAEYKEQKTPEETRALIADVMGTLGTILAIVTVLGVLAAPVIIMIFAPGFYGEETRYELTVDLLRYTFPYIFFISLTAFAGSILNTYGRFAIPAFTPVLLNISLIAVALLWAPSLDQPIYALAFGVFIAGAAQLLFQLPFLMRLGLLPMPRWGWKRPGVRKISKLMLPAIFGSSVAQINLLFDTLIASFLVAGSVSWLYYSDRLMEFPLGVFGIALATVILPTLSKQHAAADTQTFSQTLDWALRWVLIIGTPAALGLAFLASPMLTTLFQYGAFTGDDVRMATQSLMAYSMGLLGFILIKVLAPGYFARQDTKTPVKIGVIAMVANMVFNVIFVFPLAHAGLALATSLSAFLNAYLLYRGLRKDGIYQPGSHWGLLLFRILCASSAMIAVLWFLCADNAQWLAWPAWERVWRLGMLVFAGAAAYFAVLLALGERISLKR